jgi:aminomethyltransferase
MSPTLKVGIGLGYVKAEYATLGTQIAIIIRDRLIKAEIVKYPFV